MRSNPMLASTTRLTTGPTDPRWSSVITLLRALDINRVSYCLDGEGDSGDCTLEEVEYTDGRSTAVLPEVPIGFSAKGIVNFLPPALEDMAAALPEGDWVNNEGGFGTVTIRPFEEDPDDRLSCEMTYRDYCDDDDDEFGELELDHDDAASEDSDGTLPAIRIEEAGQ
jgi:hypothetical protein